MKKTFATLLALLVLIVGLGCSRRDNVSYKDTVKKALEQADLTDVSVREDADKNTVTLGGKVHSENAKQQASQVAQAAAGSRIVANEISVEPVGVESAAKKIESNTDDAIEKNYKAALISKALDNDHIRFKSKNGVLTLSGTVNNQQKRQDAQQIAANIPNVAQVVNEIQIR
jgi:osmotically-inducible protein OsmY